MFVLLDYAQDITHALKVGVFSSFIGVFLAVVTYVTKTLRDQNQDNG